MRTLRRFGGFLFSIITASLLTGCSHTVSYKLDSGDRWSGPAQNKTVRVDTFVETVALPEKGEVCIDGKDCRTNYRKRYKGKELATDASDMIARHLTHSGLFRKVVRDAAEPADLVLSGTIVEYMATGTINEGAEIGQAVSAGFGLIGAVIGTASTSGAKSQITAKVQLDPVVLCDTSGKVLFQTSITKSNQFAAHFSSASQAAIFQHPDRLLKEAVNDLVQQLGRVSQTNGVNRPDAQ